MLLMRSVGTSCIMCLPGHPVEALMEVSEVTLLARPEDFPKDTNRTVTELVQPILQNLVQNRQSCLTPLHGRPRVVGLNRWLNLLLVP